MVIEPGDIVERAHVQPLVEQAIEPRQTRTAPLFDGLVGAGPPLPDQVDEARAVHVRWTIIVT